MMPMRFFALDQSQDCHVRLAFSAMEPEQIREGVAGFARYVARRLQEGKVGAGDGELVR